MRLRWSALLVLAACHGTSAGSGVVDGGGAETGAADTSADAGAVDAPAVSLTDTAVTDAPAVTCAELQSAGPGHLFFPKSDGAISAPRVVATSETEALYSVYINGSIRVMAASRDGTVTRLLSEMEYTRSWSFDPKTIAAWKRPNGVDVLLSDEADVIWIRKEGATVQLTTLAQSHFGDLKALAIGPGTSGPIAVFSRGVEGLGPVALTAVDLEAALAPGASIASLVAQGTRALLPASGGLVGTPHKAGVWVTAEENDTSVDCRPTGEELACPSPQPAVPWLDCTLHVHAWNLTVASGLQSAPTATVDSTMRLVGDCDGHPPTDSISELHSLTLGFGRSHAIMVDPATSGLAVAVVSTPTQTTEELRVALLAPSGASLFERTIARPSSESTQSWMAPVGGSVFFCQGNACAAVSGHASAAFTIPGPMFDLRAVWPDATGITMLGLAPDDFENTWSQSLACVP